MSPILTVLADYFGWLLILVGIVCILVAGWHWACRTLIRLMDTIP